MLHHEHVTMRQLSDRLNFLQEEANQLVHKAKTPPCKCKELTGLYSYIFIHLHDSGANIYLLADFKLRNAMNHWDRSILQGLILLPQISATLSTHILHHSWMCTFL